jgi:hypothetical protein
MQISAAGVFSTPQFAIIQSTYSYSHSIDIVMRCNHKWVHRYITKDLHTALAEQLTKPYDCGDKRHLHKSVVIFLARMHNKQLQSSW